MRHPLNYFGKVFPAITLALVVWGAPCAQAQLFKKKEKDKHEEYAYPTISTQKKKEKRKSVSDESRFHVEKPLESETVTKLDRVVDYSKPPFFGHKRPPVRRPPGSQKLCRVCGIRH